MASNFTQRPTKAQASRDIHFLWKLFAIFIVTQVLFAVFLVWAEGSEILSSEVCIGLVILFSLMQLGLMIWWSSRKLLRLEVVAGSTSQELETLVYSVSHDLRAPLRCITGFSEILAEDEAETLSALGKDYLRRISAAGSRMTKLMDGMLELSKLGRREVRRTSTSFSLIANRVAEEVRRQYPERNVSLHVAENIAVRADEALLGVVLKKLVENAWKFTAENPMARLEVGRVTKDGRDVFYVRDNGVGFDMEYADKLFGPFQRLHMEGEFDGIGVGLAVVQRIVHRHGGSIWAEAAVGKGATFYFTL